MENYYNCSSNKKKPISVKDLCDRTDEALTDLGTVLVAGEVSGLSRSPAGHCYFSMKEGDYMVPCTVWASRAHIMKGVESGTQIEAEGNVRYSGKYGKLSFSITDITPTGVGKLLAEQEARKKRYQLLGWFDAQYKKRLPDHIRHIGVVTSPTGAVIRDLLDVLDRRAPNISVTVFPCPVQGVGAETVIASRIRQADVYGGLDCLIVMRGGGSIEDLAPFSTDEVVKAIHEASIPVVSAVGHETDWSLSDYVADVRAGTPSIAGEMISAPAVKRRDTYRSVVTALDTNIRMKMAEARSKMIGVSRIDDILSVKIGQATLRLANASRLEDRLYKSVDMTTYTLARLGDDIQSGMTKRLESTAMRLETLWHPAKIILDGRILNAWARLGGAEQELDALNPYSILERGYSMVTDGNGNVLTDPAKIKVGERINITTGKGRIGAVVETL